MKWLPCTLLVASSCAFVMVKPAMAGVFGSLGNFDVVNDTGKTAHGFEIDIEDPTFTKSQIYSVFGLDRDFGIPPTSVERYGAPSIIEVPNWGVKIIYQAAFANGAWSTGTDTGSFANPGEVCWALGGSNYPNVPCDHFGVGTYGTPAKITYSWLLETTPDSPNLTSSVVGIPSVSFTPPPPPTPVQPNPPQQVQAVIRAVEEPVEVNYKYGKAYWVKVFTMTQDHHVELEQLVGGSPEVPDEPAEIETEWTVFQARLDGMGVNEEKMAEVPFDEDVNKSIVRRYEFYEYNGIINPEDGEAWCDGAEAPGHSCDSPFGDGSVQGLNVIQEINDLGPYIGAQMAAFNANIVPADNNPVPEPDVVLGLDLLLLMGAFSKIRNLF